MATRKIEPKTNQEYDSISWKKDDNPVLKGEYLGRETINDLECYVIQDGEQKTVVWPSKMLEDLFPGVKEGETVILTYKGKKKSKTNPAVSYNVFELEVDE